MDNDSVKHNGIVLLGVLFLVVIVGTLVVYSVPESYIGQAVKTSIFASESQETNQLNIENLDTTESVAVKGDEGSAIAIEPAVSSIVGSTSYFYVGASSLAVKENNQIVYNYQDRLGSTRLTSQASTAKNLPFGQEILSDRRYGFSGKEQDETGIHYFNARYYDSFSGQFLSPNPIPGNGFYSYVRNNPMNLVDVSGMNPQVEAELVQFLLNYRSTIEQIQNSKRDVKIYEINYEDLASSSDKIKTSLNDNQDFFYIDAHAIVKAANSGTLDSLEASVISQDKDLAQGEQVRWVWTPPTTGEAVDHYRVDAFFYFANIPGDPESVPAIFIVSGLPISDPSIVIAFQEDTTAAIRVAGVGASGVQGPWSVPSVPYTWGPAQSGDQSLNSFSESRDLRIYPNPFYDFNSLNIMIGNKPASRDSLQVFDIRGMNIKIDNPQLISSGAYFFVYNKNQVVEGTYLR